mmetsp:Transcript_323/g.587  ORF Transcript_323/g.587 Transcript_323/m.587 type:complete len:110 (+) Transcript_323:1781-2110(+)
MNMCYYLVGTLGMYLLCVLGACYFKDLGVIFSFISSIAVTFISFWFPSFFYIVARRKYIKKFQARGANVKLNDGYLMASVWVNFLIGLLCFLTGMYANLQSLKKSDEEE